MVLVTGATGLVGSHLLYFLLKSNVSVRAVHRKSSTLETVKKVFSFYGDEAGTLFGKIEWAEADITDLPALNDAFMGIDRVYHCAAFISFDPKDFPKLCKVNIEGTANIVNLCLSHKVQKLCHVSSVATFGKTANAPVTEETDWDPEAKNSVYALSKHGAEMEVWRGTQEGLAAVIVNPSVILGPGSHSGSGAILSLAAKGTRFYPDGKLNLVDVRDVVKAMVFLMESPIKNEQFILTAETVAHKKLLSDLAVLFNNPPPKILVPKGLLFFLSALDTLLHKFFGLKRKLPKAIVRAMHAKAEYSSAKIKKEGFVFMPYEETLKNSVESFRTGKV